MVFLGTGDAFSADGSHHPSYLIQCPAISLLLDCGPDTLASLKRDRIEPGLIDAVLLSHLHGDHFGGLPFLFLEYTHVEARHRPLCIAGPPGTRRSVLSLLDIMYPDARQNLPFALDFVEMRPDQRLNVGPAVIDPFPVPHQRSGISLGLSVELAGRRIVYSGDSGWTEDLVTRSRNADLFICECSFFETRIPTHLDYPRLAENRPRFSPKRMILTHTGHEVRARRAEMEMELAEDSLVIEL